MASSRDYVYVAFDADALSLLSKIHERMERGEHIDYENDPDGLIRRYTGYAITTLNLIYQGKIRPFITNTIYQQTKFMSFIAPFIKKYGYFPYITTETRYEKRERVKKLAEEYCRPYINRFGREQRAPMDKLYNAYLDAIIPEDDAFAMAEATEENCFFVTCNEKHFIYFKGREEKKERLWGIITINRSLGCGEERETGFLTPRPFGMSEFGPLIRDGIDGLRFLQPETTISAATGEIDDLTK